MGCLVALEFAKYYPEKVEQLILLGPPNLPFPEEGVEALQKRAELVRRAGMLGIADKIAQSGTSVMTQARNQIAVAAVRMSVGGQDAEGYAKACSALAEADVPDYGKVQAKVAIITGTEDGVAPVEVCEDIVETLGGRGELKVIEGVGHWSIYEDLESVALAVEGVLERSSLA
jgi:pimeloyl-ACP methyl ester carboxylesterase